MWCLKQVDCSFKLCFSDGEPLHAVRTEAGMSYRLIVDQLGFLDLTETPHLMRTHGIIANDELLTVPSKHEVSIRRHADDLLINLYLQIDISGVFELTYIDPAINAGSDVRSPNSVSVSGKLKPLPNVSAADAAFIDAMIDGQYVPYSKIPDAPGKTTEEIKALGEKLFPFTPYSFQLAMCVYDWTTASFTRMVFLKIFEYTGMPPPPFPIDQNSIAAQVWASDWGTYNPQDEAYMHSFMMKPSDSQDEVTAQLNSVANDLHKFSNVENRLLSAAVQALPRTSIFQHVQLFSGQMDISQLGSSHFGIEFLQCPLNDGPVDKELVTAFEDVLATYVSSGKTITTKMVWSFTDSVGDAMHYSNGILLVANMSGSSWVWEQAAYVTPLSDDPKKTEYVFPPGTQFKVQSISEAVVRDQNTVVITLKLLPGEKQADFLNLNQEHTESRTSLKDINSYFEKVSPGALDENQVLEAIRSNTPTTDIPHTLHKTGGRRCACGEGN
ncbi:hypothetical protein F4805DRAFT_262606 [Annulohypoxylon moriforme]|nr:hypothetical protein F4805DRAFT_262606 [Annulohypoxylon moriforme]